MKYEISDILNEKYKYGYTILRVHKKANIGILGILISKKSTYNYTLIHFLFIIVSSMGLLILCNDFTPDYDKYLYFSNILRYLTPFYIVKILNLSHFSYIVICAIIFLICIIRILNTFHFIQSANRFHVNEVNNIKYNIIVKLLNHFVYIFFSYIIEFLFFIYYIEIFPNDFVIKKDSEVNEIIHKGFFALNAIFIIIYNINNYFFINIVNKPESDSSFPLKVKIPSSKLYIFIIFQNFSLIHPLQCYLTGQLNKIWCIIYVIIVLLILIRLFFINLNIYNYDNFLNSLLSFIGEFSFISIIIEMILFFCSIKHKTTKELLYFVIAKIGISICLFYSLRRIYQKLMMKIIYKRLFYNNPYNHPFDNDMINSVLFLRELFEQKNMKYLSKIFGYIIEHKQQCSNYNCGCKIIKIKDNIKKDDKAVLLDDLLKKLNYFIETILINFNYQNNFDLCILLSEHFHLYKKNPIMSYSILQTLLHYNYKNLNKNELITIYELMNKYIKYILLEKTKNLNLEKYLRDDISLNKMIKENELKQYFNLIIKIKKAIKYMINYSKKSIIIIKHKENYENSTNIKMDEIYNEIKYISSPYLNKNIINEILNFFSIEILYTSDIKKYLYDLEEYNKLLPYEFLYKIFLFVDYFWDGKIPDKLINIFYSFTTNRNLYSLTINPEIYNILENRYINYFNYGKNKYYLLFKYTKGIKISYASESLTRKLNYRQSDLINKNIEVLLVNDLVEPHENIVKHFFILQKNNIFKDKKKYIFDKNGYMINSKINSTLQIGINKNILMIVTIELEQKNKEILFYANKNLNIISINKCFYDNFSLSLALINEFKIEISQLFGINSNDIENNYKKEMKYIRNIKDFKILDSKEYILKNLFKHQNQNSTYHINNKYIINDNSDDSDKENEEEMFLKDKKKNNKNNLKTFENLFNDFIPELYYFRSISFQINKENFLLNLRKIFEKINSYEQDKLESKNIYNDYLRLTTNYKDLCINKNMNFWVKIEPRVVYDTVFYYCKIELNSIQSLFELNEGKTNELKNVKTETEDLNSTYNNSKTYEKMDKFSKMKSFKTNISLYQTDLKSGEDKINIYKPSHNNSYYFKEKLKEIKPSKYKLCAALLFCIFLLLISCIITLQYQTSLVHKNDKIFEALYYNYFQRTQFIYLNSAILSIFFELLNLTNQNVLGDNKDLLHLIGKNIEESHQYFIKYYMDFKIELNEDFGLLYEPLTSNKITVNWENRLFHNDYNSELALIVYRILDSIKHEFNSNDKIDCENLLLGKYLNIDRKKTPVYGNFIKLVYYFYNNFDPVLRVFFLSLEDSFDQSLNNFSHQTTSVYITLEILALLSFLFFFSINIFFLMNSNKYIFQNILFMFIDFTQINDYTFQNKYYNLLATKRISNYIMLLNEFTPKNLDALQKDKEISNNSLKYFNFQNLMNNNENKNDNKTIKNKEKYKKSKKNKENNDKLVIDTFINASLFNSNSNINLINNSTMINHSSKGLKVLNDDIHNLNNKDLNNINLNNNLNNTKNNSTNIILNSTIINSTMNNSSILGNSNNINDSHIRKSQGNSSKRINNKILNINNKGNDVWNFNDSNNKKSENEEIKITVEKVLFHTKIIMLNIIKILIIIFIIFTFIFLIYYICKLVISFLFISNFQDIIIDFKDLTSQYNNVIRYWNIMKTLFVLPNATIAENLNKTEEYFLYLNSKVNNIYKYRMKRYKRIYGLYNILLSSSLDQNLSTVHFCLDHKRCIDIKYSNNYLLANGIESTVNLYGKEIFNYYKDFLEIKDNIKTKEDIIEHFVNDRYKILSSNINHVIIYLEQLVFGYFLNDEKDIVDKFYLKIKILNIVEICFCALLNLFSVLFVYNYITRIIYSVEVASTRINNSITRIKIMKLERNN